MDSNKIFKLTSENSHQRAKEATKNTLYSNKFNLGVGIMGTLFFGFWGGFISYRYLPENASSIQQYLFPAIGSIIGIIIGVVLIIGIIYLWHRIIAIKNQRNEAREVIVKMLGEKIDSKTLIPETNSINIKVNNNSEQSLKCSARLFSLKYINESEPCDLKQTFDIRWDSNTDVGSEPNWKEIPAHEPAYLKLAQIEVYTREKYASKVGTLRDETFGYGVILQLSRLNIAPYRIVVDPEMPLEFGVKIFAHNSYSQTIIKTLKLKIHLDKDEQGVPIVGKLPYWNGEIIENDEKHDINTEIEKLELVK